MTREIPPAAGRRLFGRDADAYDAGRPDYPGRVFEILAGRLAASDGRRTLEIGAGSGRATRGLLGIGADPIVAVEPDRRFEPRLAALAETSGGVVVPVIRPFEEAAAGLGVFDLIVCATSYHWLDPLTRARALGGCLSPGGSIALVWNVFGDPRRPDPFHDATAELLAELASSPSRGLRAGLPLALDREAIVAELEQAGASADPAHEEIAWTLRLDPAGVRALYATFSPIAALPDARRETLLDALAKIAGERFGGVVERSMVTPIHVGRRRA